MLPLKSRARLQTSVAFVASAVLLWRIQSSTTLALFGLAFLLGVLAWAWPARYLPIQRGLDRLRKTLVATVSWFFLGLIYFGVFAPMRAFRALTKNDPLSLRIEPTATTYFRSLSPPDARRFTRQF